MKAHLVFHWCLYIKSKYAIGPLRDPVTCYKIKLAGEQVEEWDFQNNATRTSPPGPAFVSGNPTA